MIRLRPYKKQDAKYIVKWQTTEKVFHQWCANHFSYPLTEQQITEYMEKKAEDDSVWIMTALDEEGVPVGYFEMWQNDYKENSTYLAHVIVDSSRRGKGCGTEMIKQAVRYAFDIMHFKRMTLAVYENNVPAHICYQKAGMSDYEFVENVSQFCGESWNLYKMEITR